MLLALSGLRFNIEDVENKNLDPSNPATPVEVLEVLAKDKDRYVRAAVAENPATPVELLKVLAKDKDESVRAAVALNPATPVDLLKVLVMDQDEHVRRQATETLDTL